MERLTDDELAYHRRLVSEVKSAEAAWRSWSVHLSEKYRLGTGDSISESGEISRVDPPGKKD